MAGAEGYSTSLIRIMSIIITDQAPQSGCETKFVPFCNAIL